MCIRDRIGDGALSGGMAYEALNNLSILRREKKNMIIILNDNKMSISENVGGMSRYLNDLRSRRSYSEFKENVENALNNIPGVGKSVARTLKKSKDSIKQLFIPGMLFENMGITYYGLVNGHDIYELIHAINRAKQHEGPILIHAITRKGMGYKYAEKNPEKFHGIGPFDKETGEVLAKKTKKTYTDIFAESLVELARENKKVVAITAAMPSGTGLKAFKKHYPKRFFDVGIAEEHAVTFAAGLAAQGMRPVFAVYSSFLQSGYDQVLHDVCIQKLPVFFGIDRSGLVGADGETHQGIFDVSFLTSVPNMRIYSPSNYDELRLCLHKAVEDDSGICAVRYPRGRDQSLYDTSDPVSTYVYRHIEGAKVLLVTYGRLANDLFTAIEILRNRDIKCDIIKLVNIFPIDNEVVDIMSAYDAVLFFEEAYYCGSISEKYASICPNVAQFAIDGFVKHGKCDVLLDELGFSAEKMADTVEGFLKDE